MQTILPAGIVNHMKQGSENGLGPWGPEPGSSMNSNGGAMQHQIPTIQNPCSECTKASLDYGPDI